MGGAPEPGDGYALIVLEPLLDVEFLIGEGRPRNPDTLFEPVEVEGASVPGIAGIVSDGVLPSQKPVALIDLSR